MIVSVCIFATLTIVTMAAPTKNLDGDLFLEPFDLKEVWGKWKLDLNKTYDTPEEEEKRFKIFENNAKKIAEHNKKFLAGEITFSQGLNAFADQTHEEFASTHLMKVQPGLDKNLKTVV